MASLFPCPLCGDGEPEFAGVCGSCAERIMEAWQGPATEDEFEAWWKPLPSDMKRDKGHARNAYRKARKKATTAVLVAGIESYKSTKPAEIAFCYAATWLNGERWLDEANQGYIANGSDDERMRRNVQWFADKGMWLTPWGPRPDEPDADPKVRRLYEEVRT